MYHDLGIWINKIKPLSWIGVYHDLGIGFTRLNLYLG